MDFSQQKKPEVVAQNVPGRSASSKICRYTIEVFFPKQEMFLRRRDILPSAVNYFWHQIPQRTVVPFNMWIDMWADGRNNVSVSAILRKENFDSGTCSVLGS